MKISSPAASCAALSLVAGIGLMAPVASAAASPPNPAATSQNASAQAAAAPYISEIAYTIDSDFVEIAADPGTDLSGWTIGSVTRGGSVQAEENRVTVPANTTVSESGALAIEVPISNSVDSGSAADGKYGASAFAIDDSGALVSFDQIGGVTGGKGVTGKSNKNTPEPVVGQEAKPTGATAAGGGGNSIQLIDGKWQSASASPNELPGGTDPEPEPEDVTPIAEIQGTGPESPLKGKKAKTRGVVTAAYPTGGLAGYFVQTPGSGGAEDATPGASDGIFVYSPDTVKNVNIGDNVEVTGSVSENYGQTQISVAAAGAKVLTEPAEAVKPVEGAFPSETEEREALEGMLIQPNSELTVSDNYSTNRFGEVALATGSGALPQPTDKARPGSDEAKAIAADNLKRQLVLDDGASVDYLEEDKNIPLPYLSNDAPVRVGAKATITSPVVLGYGFNLWRFQPTTRLTGDNAEAIQPASFENTRTEAPESVGGQVSLASFNVLNYFTTTGDKLSGCNFYNDREGKPVTVNDGCDARGAANAANLERQESKIVAAINKLDASVVSLMEIENSIKFGPDRDAALSTLVDALNEAAGSKKWDFVPSPAAVPADEDVIRTALIYQTAEVAPRGESTILDDEDAFSNAREPLSQAFAPKDSAGEVETDKTFVTLSNHFKSKGSGSGPGNEDTGDGQGASNADRVKQAKALVSFADEQKKAASSEYVYLLGDFNSYTQEDPMQVLYEAGYKDVAAEKDETATYLFKGLTGSLDHVLALETSASGAGAAGAQADLPSSAFAAVTGADVWNINSVEALALEYSRFNYNAAELFQPDQFRASDHDPVKVGIFESDDENGAKDDDETAGDDGNQTADGSDANDDKSGSSANDDKSGSVDGNSKDGGPAGADDGSATAGNSGSGSGGSDSSNGSSSSNAGRGGNLPRTGSDLLLPVSISGGLLLAGAAALLIARRRRADSDSMN